MKKDINIEGDYNSTNAFVHQNKLQRIATKVLGKGWEAEDDVNQINEIINAMNIGKYLVEWIEGREEDDILVRKVSDVGNKDIDDAFTKLISLYDICDILIGDGNDKDAEFMRDKLNNLGTFIQSLKN